MMDYLIAAFLGFVEGLTEFIPVSSTGHLILLVDLLKFQAPPGRVFEVFIQMGAILAVMVLYWRRLFETCLGIFHQKTAQQFTLNLAVGTVPAIIVGAAAHDFIKTTLYDPHVVAWMLVVGAGVILLMDRPTRKPRIHAVDDISWQVALKIGVCQALALIPGVSRSGATIIGGLWMGLRRETAAEFSFFLAMPAMLGAVTYDTYKNWHNIQSFPNSEVLLVGFAAAFITALAVVRLAMRIISRYGFAPFAWYRLAVGGGMLALLYL